MNNNYYSMPNSGTLHFSLNHEPNYLTESEERQLYLLFALILLALTAVIVYIFEKALEQPAVDYNNNNENILQHNRQQG